MTPSLEQTEHRARKKLPPGLVRYKPLPPGWRESQHYWFYGWPVTDESLHNYVLKHLNLVKHLKNPDLVKSAAFTDMRLRSGYEDLCFVGAIPDAETISKGFIIQYPGQQNPEVHLMALSCTRSTRLYHRRPTKEQLAILTELFGEEPRWFEDCHLKKDFMAELMDVD